MACLVVPDFGDPHGIRVRRILRNDVAEAARHAFGPLEQDRDDGLALAGCDEHLSDQSVHASLTGSSESITACNVECRRYLPVNLGLRFSRKADVPSSLSSDE